MQLDAIESERLVYPLHTGGKSAGGEEHLIHRVHCGEGDADGVAYLVRGKAHCFENMAESCIVCCAGRTSGGKYLVCVKHHDKRFGWDSVKPDTVCLTVLAFAVEVENV